MIAVSIGEEWRYGIGGILTAVVRLNKDILGNLCMVLISRFLLKQICKDAKTWFLQLCTLYMMLKGINRSTSLLVYGRKVLVHV